MALYDAEKGEERTATEARQGRVNGHIVVILSVSLALALIALAVLLGYVYTSLSPPG